MYRSFLPPINSDINLIQWARTPPSASWRFESGRDRQDRQPASRRERSPRRRSQSPPRRRDSPSRRDRDYDRRDRTRSRSPDTRDDRDRERDRDRDRDAKDTRDRDDHRENGNATGDDRKGKILKLFPNYIIINTQHSNPTIDTPPPAHDELDTAE
jgi:hypothetical protein